MARTMAVTSNGAAATVSVGDATRRSFLLASAAALTLGATPEVGFPQFLAELRREAVAQGVNPATLDAALNDLRPIDKILELDRAQPERKLGFAEYLRRAVNGERVRIGRLRTAEHRPLLDSLGEKYGVEPRVIIALWGMETDYGAFIGGYPVIAALATLAWDGRRTFFRRELLQALRILDQGHVSAGDMRGSWAGAMGQAQFMPSSFTAYAVDHDGDGRKDIWRSTADVLASIGNYLKQVGWRAELGWGQPVKLPPGFAFEAVSLEISKPIEEWARLGVRAEADQRLPAPGAAASIIQPGGAKGPAYAVTENYRAIMRWNRSQYFATATGLLADRLAGA